MPNALVTDISSVNWQLSTGGYGRIVQNADDIQQCLGMIFTTQKGSDPLRPDFGIDLLAWIDTPTPVAAPGIVNEMIQAAVYEPRINISAIQAFEEPHKVTFKIIWQYVSDFNPKTAITGVLPNQEVSYFVLSTITGLFINTSGGDNIIAQIL